MTREEGGGCGPRWGWARKGRHRGGHHLKHGRRFDSFSSGEGRIGRMFGQGDLRLLLLALIADKPSHGYDLIRTIEAKFGGSYAPSPGAIYPTLTLLEEQELVISEAEPGGKKSYTATPQGREFLADNSDEVKALMARIDVMAGATTSGSPPDRVMQAIHTLRHAIASKAGGWSAAEADRVALALETAAREIVKGGGAEMSI